MFECEGLQVTSLESSKPLSEFDWSEPTAVIFGNGADHSVWLYMYFIVLFCHL